MIRQCVKTKTTGRVYESVSQQSRDTPQRIAVDQGRDTHKR